MEATWITHENVNKIEKDLSDYKDYKESLPNIMIPQSFKSRYGYVVKFTTWGMAYIVN